MSIVGMSWMWKSFWSEYLRRMRCIEETPESNKFVWRLMRETSVLKSSATALKTVSSTMLDGPDDEDIVFQRRAIETALELESAGGPFEYTELFGGGKLQNLRRMILCGAVNVMQQFTGKLFRSQCVGIL